MLQGIENLVGGIAIIGMAARVPGARDIHQMWRNLADGRESIIEFSREDQIAKGIRPEVVDDPAFVSAAPTLEDMEDFDAEFFGMAPREAEITDPQHRLFLELSHTALEDAGYDPRRYGGAIGVYGGCGPDTYRWRNIQRSSGVLNATNWLAITVGNYPDYFATRVSYRLDLRGPSYGLQTACSTSLVALHVAGEALRRDECDMAVAGGVCIELPHGVGYVYDGGVTSRDGHCRPFDASASGTVWSSGGGVVLLKRIDKAIADGDHIRAVALGSAINNDGATKSGITAPSADGQAHAARRALTNAGVAPRSVTYVEAHGTGTHLGDPVELAGLSTVYGRDTDEAGWCLLGSIKSNVGHLSQAAGVVGVIKTVLSLEHAQIPPTINFSKPNSALGLAASPFRIATELHDWERANGPLRAGVSSFGIGGTNAHVVLQEAPPQAPSRLSRPTAQMLPISARSAEALEVMRDRIQSLLAGQDRADLADIAYTLRVGRSIHRHRAFAVLGAEDSGAAVGDRNQWYRGVADKAEPHVAFLFPGQGAQYQGMAAAFHEREQVFREAVDDCLAEVAPELQGTLSDLLLKQPVDTTARSPLDQTRYTQPVLFVFEYALARLWMSWGLAPAAMIGHSVGEYVAATLADVFSVGDALRLVVRRAELMQSTPTGSMLSVQFDGDADQLDLPDGLAIACFNAPGAVVVSGAADTVRFYARRLGEQGVATRELATSHAFHSAMMEPILEVFRAEVAAVPRGAPISRYLSNLTGTWQTAEQAQDPEYWVEHLRRPVRFTENVTTVCEDGRWAFVECGPGHQLTGFVLTQERNAVVTAMYSVPGPHSAEDPVSTILRAAGTVWTVGVPLDLDAFGPPGRRVPLPTYPYQRRRHWATPDPQPPREDVPTPAIQGAAARPVARWFYVESWRRDPHPPPPGRAGGCVLFVADTHGERVGKELRDRGACVVEVRPGTAYERIDDRRYTIDPSAAEDYRKLVHDIGGAALRHVVHAWSLGALRAGGDADAVMRAQERGFYSLVHLAQAVLGTGSDEPVHLDVVTAGALDVVGGDLDKPEQATVSGIARVLPLESPLFSVRHVDCDPRLDVWHGTSSIVDEILRAPGQLDTVSLRASRRWLPEYRELLLNSSARPDTVLRERGVYLITGGLGGIGLTLAEDLAQRVRARLVLTSRVGLPARKGWDRYLAARGDSDRSARAIRAIQRMEERGAEVLVLAADVTEPADMAEVRETVTTEFGQLDGVIHAAGIPTGTMLEIMDCQVAEQVLAPKLRGALVVHEALRELHPDFLLLCSSITAAFGRLGHADYCAANSFLDAYARQCRGGDIRVLSVGWDAWLDIGMAVDRSEPAELRAARQAARRDHGAVAPDDEEHVGIKPVDGVDAFRRLISAGVEGHVLTSVLPVEAARAGWRVGVDALAPAARSEVPSAVEADSLEEILAKIWADILGHPVVGLDQDFVELGGDSLSAIRLLGRIRTATNVELSRRSLFEASTVRQLAIEIAELQSCGADAAGPVAGTARSAAIARLSRG